MLHVVDARGGGCRPEQMSDPRDAGCAGCRSQWMQQPVGCRLRRTLTVAGAGAQRMLHVPAVAGARAAVGSRWAPHPPCRRCRSQAQVGAGQVLSQPGPAAVPAGSHGRRRALLRHRHRGPLCGGAGCRRLPLCGAVSPCCSPGDGGDGTGTGTHTAAPGAMQGTPRQGVLGCWGCRGRKGSWSRSLPPPFPRREEAGCGPCPARPGWGPGGDLGCVTSCGPAGKCGHREGMEGLTPDGLGWRRRRRMEWTGGDEEDEED